MNEHYLYVQDVEAFAAECAFHPGLMIAGARALKVPGGNVGATILSCLQDDEEQYVQRMRHSISLRAVASKELLATMSLLPGGAFIPIAVVSRIHRRWGLLLKRWALATLMPLLQCQFWTGLQMASSYFCLSQAAWYGAATGAAACAQLAAASQP